MELIYASCVILGNPHNILKKEMGFTRFNT